MTGVAVEISRGVGEKPRNRTCSLEEALERYCRRRWRVRTAAMVAEEWGLSRDEAREVVRGRASKAVLNKVAHHRRGGLPVMLALLENVTGQTAADLFADRRARALRHYESVPEPDFGPWGRS